MINTSDEKVIADKLRRQNARLKEEFIALKEQLQRFQEKLHGKEETSEWQANSKESFYQREIKDTDKLIEHYKKQVEALKDYLESSFDIERWFSADG